MNVLAGEYTITCVCVIEHLRILRFIWMANAYASIEIQMCVPFELYEN